MSTQHKTKIILAAAALACIVAQGQAQTLLNFAWLGTPNGFGTTWSSTGTAPGDDWSFSGVYPEWTLPGPGVGNGQIGANNFGGTGFAIPDLEIGQPQITIRGGFTSLALPTDSDAVFRLVISSANPDNYLPLVGGEWGTAYSEWRPFSDLFAPDPGSLAIESITSGFSAGSVAYYAVEVWNGVDDLYYRSEPLAGSLGFEVNPIPEPTTAALVCIGFAVFAYRFRSRSRSRLRK